MCGVTFCAQLPLGEADDPDRMFDRGPWDLDEKRGLGHVQARRGAL